MKRIILTIAALIVAFAAFGQQPQPLPNDDEALSRYSASGEVPR